MHPNQMTILILAGDPKSQLAAQGNQSYLQLALDIARDLQFYRVIVVCPSNVQVPTAFLRVAPGKSLGESLLAGMRHVHCTEYVLVLAADLKSSADDVRKFCEAARDSDCPVYCGAARIKECRAIKPNVRTHLVCAFGKVRLASAYIIKTSWFAREPRSRAILKDRKSIAKVAGHVMCYFVGELLRTLFLQRPQFPKLVRVPATLAVDYDIPANK